MFPVRYELGFYIPEDDIPPRQKNLESIADHLRPEIRISNIENSTFPYSK
jgi:hypothetical protein